ncbi:hypothetical protein CDG76_34200 [Nostoc sp. 'Peltigera membranacea cyanobiont' 210A]|nr:hypothetical protein CDG76_34200 [Nostoc sp. 'Peltigera membranacea cyanobiont' 210A]
MDCGDGTVIHYTNSQRNISRVSRAYFTSGITVLVKEYGQCDTPDIIIWHLESRLGEKESNRP